MNIFDIKLMRKYYLIEIIYNIDIVTGYYDFILDLTFINIFEIKTMRKNSLIKIIYNKVICWSCDDLKVQ